MPHRLMLPTQSLFSFFRFCPFCILSLWLISAYIRSHIDYSIVPTVAYAIAWMITRNHIMVVL